MKCKLALLGLLLALVIPVRADPDQEDPVARTRRRVVGIWTSSRDYYTLRTGNAEPEAIEYHTITKVLPDGTWTSSTNRHGTWAVEEEDLLVLDPHTLQERIFKLTFSGSEMIRKGPYLRDGKLLVAGTTYIYYENIAPLEKKSLETPADQ